MRRSQTGWRTGSTLCWRGQGLLSVQSEATAGPYHLELRDALIKDFDIDTGGESISLARAYDHLSRRDRTGVSKYLKSWFTGCRPSWQGLLAEFNWHRIWTLNIDDVLEIAFQAQGRPLQTFGWRQRFVDRNWSRSSQIIHLHGSAAQLLDPERADEPLVFSIQEYARALADARSWHGVLFDEFAERPFIIIGARLSEEFDLAELLNSGTAAERQTGFPSVVVTPTLTALRKQELFALGLTVIESDGETFVRTLLEHYRTAIQSLSGEYGGAISPELAKFLQQFIDLRSYDPSGVQTTRDFYAGYEPTWGTIAADDDAILQLSEQVATAVGAAAVADEVTQQVYFLSGRPGTGKSTILLRVAQTLIGLGVRPFLFRADEGIDVEAVVHWLRTVPRTVLLFDDCADFARAIQRLSETCREENVRLLAFGTERTGRIRAIRDAISSTFLRPDPPYVSGRLSDSDIGTLLDKLNSRGRLGHITRFSPDRQRSYFMQTAGRRLFEGMAGLEGGLGFNLKVRRDYDNLSSDSGRVAYAAACIAYELGVALPPGTACEVAGMRTRELVAFVEADGADLLELTRGGLRPPHRITASLLVRLLPRPVRFSITLSTIKALARHVDRQAISSMTRPYRLVRQLMDRRPLFVT